MNLTTLAGCREQMSKQMSWTFLNLLLADITFSQQQWNTRLGSEPTRNIWRVLTRTNVKPLRTEPFVHITTCLELALDHKTVSDLERSFGLNSTLEILHFASFSIVLIIFILCTYRPCHVCNWSIWNAFESQDISIGLTYAVTCNYFLSFNRLITIFRSTFCVGLFVLHFYVAVFWRNKWMNIIRQIYEMFAISA